MHKRLFVTASVIFIIILTSNLYASYVTSAIGVYKFASKVIKCEISYDNRSTWRTLWDNTSNEAAAPTVDIGAGSVSAQMGTFMSGISVPIGTVTDMRVTVTTSLTIRGWVKSGATYYYTDNTVPTLQTNSQAGVPTDGQCTEITVGPPAGSGIPSTMTDTVTITGGGLVITNGGTHNISIIFPMNSLLGIQMVEGFGMIMPAEVTPTVSPQ